jgi:hypothetical protein
VAQTAAKRRTAERRQTIGWNHGVCDVGKSGRLELRTAHLGGGFAELVTPVLIVIVVMLVMDLAPAGMGNRLELKKVERNSVIAGGAVTAANLPQVARNLRPSFICAPSAEPISFSIE